MQKNTMPTDEVVEARAFAVFSEAFREEYERFLKQQISIQTLRNVLDLDGLKTIIDNAVKLLEGNNRPK